MKVELDVSIVKSMLPMMEQKLESLNDEIEGKTQEAADLAAAIAIIKNGGESKLQTASGEPRQRMPKGQGDKIIHNLLKSLPDGQGLTTSEIVNKSGVKYASVYRILTLKNKGRFVNENDKWKLKK